MPMMSFPWIFSDTLRVLAKSGAPYNGKIYYANLGYWGSSMQAKSYGVEYITLHARDRRYEV